MRPHPKHVALALLLLATASPTASTAASPAASPVAGASEPPAAGTVAAVWSLAPGQSITEESTGFLAAVVRVECNSGGPSMVVEPQIDRDRHQVTVTFRVTPPAGPGAQTCQGTAPILHRVDLGEPLGARDLVDGQCAADAAVAGTSHCAPTDVRHRGRKPTEGWCGVVP